MSAWSREITGSFHGARVSFHSAKPSFHKIKARFHGARALSHETELRRNALKHVMPVANTAKHTLKGARNVVCLSLTPYLLSAVLPKKRRKRSERRVIHLPHGVNRKTSTTRAKIVCAPVYFFA
jgi:hypothetical protein